jgi:predicted DNA-binding transcriptional regulator AlpA
MVTKERPARLLSIPEGARFLGVREPVLRRAVEDGQMPSVLLGAQRWVSVENLQKSVEGTLDDED